MEVATMMPYRMEDGFRQGYHPHYAQYHDLRTQHAPTAPHNRHSDYQPSQQTAADSYPQQPSPTPPDDAHKPSLPSISKLLGIADGDRASQPSADDARSAPQQQVLHQSHPQSTYTEQPSYTAYPQVLDGSNPQRPALPPTPPMRMDSMPDPANSPSTVSSQSSFSAPNYYVGSALNNVEAAQQRIAQPQHIKAHSMPHQAVYAGSPYNIGPYLTSPSSVSTSSYYSPPGLYAQNGIYQQQPLPTSFPPTVMAAPMLPPGAMPIPFSHEHHHYINPSSSGTFSSVQDRYVCVTCKKAFSRPSSLKIHSHSHTGEKPFKCPHPGCGKAFSVRSNMKRHERGCHVGDPEGPSS